RLRVHHVGDLQALDPGKHRRLVGGATRGLAQEEADEDEPRTADEIARLDEDVDPNGHQYIRKELAELSGEIGRSGAVAGPPPGDRPGDPPSIERKGRYQ